MDVKKTVKRFWHFIWEEDSIASWIANIILAFLLIKFIVYPGLGFILATSHPVVAVISGSMEHEGSSEDWWNYGCPQGTQGDLYWQLNIRKEQFNTFPFKNGFNKGDIMVLYGRRSPQLGDVIVFNVPGRNEPIIHRVVNITDQQLYKTKGDHNCGSAAFEERITEPQIIGRAIARIPYLGWVKLLFTELLQVLGVPIW